MPLFDVNCPACHLHGEMFIRLDKINRFDKGEGLVVKDKKGNIVEDHRCPNCQANLVRETAAPRVIWK